MDKKVYIHLHCHQKSLAGKQATIDALSLIPKLKVEILNTGCCGMAGDFGYRHPEISEEIAYNSFDNYIEKITEKDILVITGISCRKQILNVFSAQCQHLPRLFIESIKAD
jgi:Fe-S oxidoreductase